MEQNQLILFVKKEWALVWINNILYKLIKLGLLTIYEFRVHRIICSNDVIDNYFSFIIKFMQYENSNNDNFVNKLHWL